MGAVVLGVARRLRPKGALITAVGTVAVAVGVLVAVLVGSDVGVAVGGTSVGGMTIAVGLG